MKKLITDQLIEEYQKEIKSKREYFDFVEGDDNKLAIMNHIAILETIITDLQSLRQQEEQNIVTAYRDGEVVSHLYKDGNHYLTSTFQQQPK